ncbi:MAG: hypothetical protein Q4C54_00950 [Clostridia bacterium]|nr:hypothetical protein [Clostridia bacterium]
MAEKETRNESKSLFAMLIAIVLFAGLPRALPDASAAKWLVPLCLLGWLAGACLQVFRPRQAWLIPVSAAVGAILRVPQHMGLYGLLGLVGAAGLMLSGKLKADFRWRIAVWCGAAMAASAAMMLYLQQFSGETPAYALAHMVHRMVEASPRCGEMLASLWQMGIVGTGSHAAVRIVKIGTTVAMPQETQLQLLYSLRSVLEDSLTLMLPQLIGAMIVAIPVLCVLAPDHFRRRGKIVPASAAICPRLESFTIPLPWRSRVFALYMLELLGTFGSGVIATWGLLCGSIGEAMLFVQGISCMLWLLDRGRLAVPVRWLLLAAASVMMPVIPVLFGAADLIFLIRARGANNKL